MATETRLVGKNYLMEVVQHLANFVRTEIKTSLEEFEPEVSAGAMLEIDDDGAIAHQEVFARGSGATSNENLDFGDTFSVTQREYNFDEYGHLSSYGSSTVNYTLPDAPIVPTVKQTFESLNVTTNTGSTATVSLTLSEDYTNYTELAILVAESGTTYYCNFSVYPDIQSQIAVNVTDNSGQTVWCGVFAFSGSTMVLASNGSQNAIDLKVYGVSYDTV